MLDKRASSGGLGLFALSLLAVVSYGQNSIKINVSLAGSGTVSTMPSADNGIGNPEVDPASIGDDGSDGPLSSGKGKNRTIATVAGKGPTVNGSGRAKSDPGLLLSFTGITQRDQRLTNGGNQFTVEPPDQGLCAGNGYVLESVNDALRIYDASGNALTGVIDLNTFYGYPAAINRSNGKFGADVFDPACHYDSDTQRWFQIAAVLDRVGTTSGLAGPNHIDIAVSATANPLGAWNIYHLPVQNNGTQGTPNHHCSGGFCFGDYPHIGADANAIFITTNEFELFGPGFNGAQIYALSKRQMAAGAANVNAVLFNTGDPNIPFPGFTVWPAISAPGSHSSAHGGTEYLLSSLAVFTDDGTSNQLVMWAVSNTKSIDSASPSLSLNGQYVNVDTYGVPPSSDQKPGDFPFGQCLANTTITVGSAHGCWRNFFASGGPFANTEKKIDSNDSRMQQVWFANGKLWGALDTAVTVGGATKAGIAYYVINPNSGKLFNQGVVAVANNNVSYPAIAVDGTGRGVMAFTLVGADHYPSAAYTSMDEKIGAGDIHVAAEGAGPDDGFSGYNPRKNFGSRSRWGDYGAAAYDGTNFWIASEFINQTCTLAQYVSSSFSCGSTRTSQGNWATRITKLVP